MRAALFLIVVLMGNALLGAEAQDAREWLLGHLIADMQERGGYNAEKYEEVQKKIDAMSDRQIGVLIQYYKQAKAQAVAAQHKESAQLREAQAELAKAQAYRNRLRREMEVVERYKQNEAELLELGGSIVKNQIRAAGAGFAGATYIVGPTFYPVAEPSDESSEESP